MNAAPESESRPSASTTTVQQRGHLCAREALVIHEGEEKDLSAAGISQLSMHDLTDTLAGWARYMRPSLGCPLTQCT